MKFKYLSLFFALLLMAGLIPRITTASAAESEPKPLVEGACNHDSELSSDQPELYAMRPSYSGSLYAAATQRVADTFAFLDEFYIEKYPEEALLIYAGKESDKDAIKYFAESVTEGCTTDTEKAQAVNTWLRRNIEYAGYASAYANDTLYRREGNCLSFAVLMQYAMRSLGIPAVVGEGWRCDTTQNDVSYFNKPGHAWCFVYLNDEWVLYDPLWLLSGTTDREYIANYIYLDTTGFICPVSDEDNLPPVLYDKTKIYYCNDRVFMWSFGEPEGVGNYNLTINNMPHYFVSNQCDGDISDGMYIVDGELDKSQMKKGEVYRNAWISYGDYSKNKHIQLFYAHPNGTIAYGTIYEFDGEELFCYGSSTHPIRADEKDYEIIDGRFTLRPGYSGPFLGTHYDKLLSDPDYTMTIESEDPSIATVDENGNITCHSTGRVYLDYTVTHYDSTADRTALMAQFSIMVVVSDEERVLDLTEKHYHDYNIELVDATCTEEGYNIYTCECGDSYTDDYFGPYGHDYYASELKDATCTEQGYMVFSCSRCGDSYTGNYEDPLGHDCGWRLKAATCTEPGWKEYFCHRCGDEWTQDHTDPLGHNYEESVVPSTCTEKGYTLHECSRCHDSYKTNFTNVIPHEMGNWYEIDNELQRRNCNNCGYFESRTTPAPVAPVIKGSNDSNSGKPKLTWNSIDGVGKYKVYGSSSKTGKYSLLKTVYSNSYIHANAKSGTMYYYKVKAVGLNGLTSKESNIVSRTCDLARPVVKAANVASSGKIKLTWNKIDGAVSYNVYRSTSKNGTYSLMKKVTGTNYTNTTAKAGKLYYYKVEAVHKKSAANSAKSAYVSRTCDLARPTITVKLSGGKPKISWAKVDGAVKYKVYRSTSLNGTYSIMKTVTGTSYVNANAKAGKTYYYKVVAVHTNTAANSAYSTAKYIKSK